jgi:hypothetical protein
MDAPVAEQVGHGEGEVDQPMQRRDRGENRLARPRYWCSAKINGLAPGAE